VIVREKRRESEKSGEGEVSTFRLYIINGLNLRVEALK
jgi:hypothetical protein